VLTRGRAVFTPMFLSRLAPVLSRYVDLKRALGRRFDLPARTLQSLDRFLRERSAQYPDLNAAAFEGWCHTHEHVSSGVRRVRMLEVAGFCLYRRRTEPQCFAPDPSSFPAYHQRVKPYIFLRGRGSETPSRGLRLAALSGIASAPGGDPPRDSSAVHHWNPPRRTAGSDARRLQSAGIDPAHSRDQVL